MLSISYESLLRILFFRRQKGSDASWHHNNEPPITCLDFSDDEDEARAKRSVAVSVAEDAGILLILNFS